MVMRRFYEIEIGIDFHQGPITRFFNCDLDFDPDSDFDMYP